MTDENFNWQQIHQRVNAALAKVEQGYDHSPAEVERILKDRARALALQTVITDTQECLELLEFELADDRYAVETRCTREVYPLDNLTPLPCTPEFVTGIVNIRGEIISVIDIKRFFGITKKGISHLNKVIVLESDTMTFGILADDIIGVRHVSTLELQSSRQGPTGIDGSYLQGITNTGLAILNAEALLEDKNIVVQS
jgi:purine-binding chemotaxis protein CheW